MTYYILLTLVTLSGEPVIVNGQSQTEHYAEPYTIYSKCMRKAWEMADAKTPCSGQRPDKCQVRWKADCTTEEPK